ncbi:MAG: type IV pilus twitching motility protein PilT [Planctomycetota bacterium]|nr:MAG: type IV pilus twitching motility protein PilT [Planctomycetota bacterium]
MGGAEAKKIKLPPNLAKIEAKDVSHFYGKGVKNYLKFARQVGASDLHLASGAKPFMRLNGHIIYMNHPVLEPEVNKKQLLEILDERDREKFLETLDLDFSFELEGLGRFRANMCQQRRGVDGTFRLIPQKIPTLKELGIPESVRKFTTFHQGLVLVTGPAGSGKSSTLAALIEIVNQERHDHIITVEDPIEFVFESKGCNVTQRQVERHTSGWGTAIRAALREDPDIIMIGEMRDLDTISTAITAAETGHLVFGTLHTTNAIRTVDRILDVFPPKEQAQIRAMVSESLRGIISQQLLPRADGTGMVPAIELLFTTSAVSNLIREARTFQLYSVMQTGRKYGMKLMDESIMELLRKKVIDKETAIYYANDPKRFERL